MKIIDIQYHPSDGNFKIVFESQESIFLDYRQYEQHQLSINMEILSDHYFRLKELSLYTYARRIAVNYMSYRLRSIKEVQERLSKEDFPDDLIQNIIKELESDQYLNDETFTRQFINEKIHFHQYSKERLLYELRAKGIEHEMAGKILTEIDPDWEYTCAKKIAERKWILLGNANTLKKKQKLYAYLSAKGFDYGLISRVEKELVSN